MHVFAEMWERVSLHSLMVRTRQELNEMEGRLPASLQDRVMAVCACVHNNARKPILLAYTHLLINVYAFMR